MTTLSLYNVNDWILSDKDQYLHAMDMHCCDILTDIMKDYNISKDEYSTFTSLVWDRKSSLYSRICYCTKDTQKKHDDSKYPYLVIDQDPNWWKQINNNSLNQRWKLNHCYNVKSLHFSQFSILDQYSFQAWQNTKVNGNNSTTLKEKTNNTNKRKSTTPMYTSRNKRVAKNLNINNTATTINQNFLDLFQ